MYKRKGFQEDILRDVSSDGGVHERNRTDQFGRALSARDVDRLSLTIRPWQCFFRVGGGASQETHEGLRVDGRLVRDEAEMTKAHAFVVRG